MAARPSSGYESRYGAGGRDGARHSAGIVGAHGGQQHQTKIANALKKYINDIENTAEAPLYAG